MKISLAAARKNVDLTQKEVSAMIGVSNNTLCNWENGKSFPNVQQIEKLCDLYGVSYDDINFLPNDSL